MDITTQEPKEQSSPNKARDRERSKPKSEGKTQLRGGRAETAAAEDKRPENLVAAFELEGCLEEALEEWRLSFPKRRVITRIDDAFVDPIVGDADALQSL